MSRILKMIWVLVAFLDVAVFPSSCATNKYENYVYIHMMLEEENGDGTFRYEHSSFFGGHQVFGNFKIGDTITDEDVTNYLENLELDENIKFTIEKYQIRSNGEHKDITLPYTVQSEDKVPYYIGIRGAAHFIVIIKMDNAVENARK